MKDFGQVTPRMKQFRDQIIGTQSSVCTERARLTTDAYRQYESEPLPIKRALMLRHILSHMSIFIEEETLIVGNQAKVNRAAPIFPEYAMDWVANELDQFDKRDGDLFTITEEDKDIIREIYPYWKGRTLQDKAYASYPSFARAVYDLGIIRNEGNITSGDAHLAVDYETVLQKGLEFYRQRTEEKLRSLRYEDPEEMKKSYFYEAVLIAIEAVEIFAGRFAELAEKQARTASPERAAELLEIARICRKVPMRKAESFHEAIQSVWFLQLILQIESNGHSLSFGRFDRYMYPFYEKSLREGVPVSLIRELLDCLWIKTLTINKVRSARHSKFQAGLPMYQNVTIGGSEADGSDSTNAMSFEVLYSVARMKLTQPNLTVRYHRNLDNAFFMDCLEVVALGFGMPAFNSDEIILPMLRSKGVSAEDASQYSAIGCVEVGVPGKWGYRCTGMSYLNFPKTLMIALNDGVDLRSGQRICAGTGHFLGMDSFEDVLHAWDTVARHLIRIGVVLDNCADLAVEKEVPDILCSALVNDCIERGKHLKEGGAVYDIVSQLQVGIANLGNCLAAIKKNVFEEHTLTKEQLWEALTSNYTCENGEKIRQLLLESPKYGNDDDYVDSLTVLGYDTYLDEIRHHKNTRYGRGPIGGGYFAGTSSVASNVPQGKGTPATPDGRRDGEPLAEGCSPAHGTDLHGPTAVMKSVTKLKTEEIFGGVLLNQKITPQALSTEEDKQKLAWLLRTFFDELKGYHIQYNVVSRETLLAAQKHPEEYRDLVVRVAGYSAFFTVLPTETQNDIIARTEQTLQENLP